MDNKLYKMDGTYIKIPHYCFDVNKSGHDRPVSAEVLQSCETDTTDYFTKVSMQQENKHKLN